jgi:hypothetical protein
MMTSVPQFIDVEDKVAGPFSWRQLGWMVGMGAVLFLLYTVLSSGMFYIAAVPIVILFFALAFYRPNGMALPQFVFYSVSFLFRPKVIVWERPVLTQRQKTTAGPAPAPVEVAPAKRVSLEEIAALARQVDTHR